MPPVNDNFASVTDLGTTTSGSIAGTTLAATLQPGEFSPGVGRTVWYKWTCPAGVLAVRFDTDTNHYHQLYSDGVGLPSFGRYLTDDLSRCGLTYQHTPPLVPGDVYYLQIDARFAAADAFTLTWQTWTATTNDDFADAINLGSALTGSDATSTLFGATFEPGEANDFHGSTGSIWYKWTCPADEGFGVDASFNLNLSRDGDTLLGFDSYMTVYVGTSLGDLVVVTEDDDSGAGAAARVDFVATAGVVYWFQVTGLSSGSTGTITIAWSAEVIEPPPEAPANDNFADAINLGNNTTGSRTGTNVGATFEDDEEHQNGSGENTIWYRWTAPPDSTTATFDTNGSFVQGDEGDDLDTVLAVYTGTTLADLEVVADDDDGGDDTNSLVTFDVTPGTVYYIQVGGYSDDEVGTIHLHWLSDGTDGGDDGEEEPPPPPPPPPPPTRPDGLIVMGHESRLHVADDVVSIDAEHGIIPTDRSGVTLGGWTFGVVDSASIPAHTADETLEPTFGKLSRSAEGRFLLAMPLVRSDLSIFTRRRLALFKVDGRTVTLLDIKGDEPFERILAIPFTDYGLYPDYSNTEDSEFDNRIGIASKAEDDLHALYRISLPTQLSGVLWRPFSVADGSISWLHNTIPWMPPRIPVDPGDPSPPVDGHIFNPSRTFEAAMLWLDTDTVALFTAPQQWGWVFVPGPPAQYNPIRLDGLIVYSTVYDVSGGDVAIVSESSAPIRADRATSTGQLTAAWRGGKRVKLFGLSGRDVGETGLQTWECEWENGVFGAITTTQLEPGPVQADEVYDALIPGLGTMDHASERAPRNRTDVYVERDVYANPSAGPGSLGSRAVLLSGTSEALIPGVTGRLSADPNRPFLLTGCADNQHTFQVTDYTRPLYAFGAFRDSDTYIRSSEPIAAALSPNPPDTLMLAMGRIVVGTTLNFYFTGAEQTLTVPEGARVMSVLAIGGNSHFPFVPAGIVVASFAVEEGDDYFVYVGGTEIVGAGGWNGGGDANEPTFQRLAQGGAGATDIRHGGHGLEHRIIVAGGPGGSIGDDFVFHWLGGMGGGSDGLPDGGNGAHSGSPEGIDTGGRGATQLAGGAPGATVEVNGPDGLFPTAGTLGQGGHGANRYFGTGPVADGDKGAGGGGGYFGGGGGGVEILPATAHNLGAGGGGSSWADPDRATHIAYSTTVGDTSAVSSVVVTFFGDDFSTGVMLLGDAEPEGGTTQVTRTDERLNVRPGAKQTEVYTP